MYLPPRQINFSTSSLNMTPKLKQFKSFYKILSGFLISCWTSLTMATPAADTTLGDAATTALVPVNFFITTLYSICYILGTIFILASGIRYKEYRDNPSQTPISRCILIFIFGLVLLALPFIAKLSQSLKM